MIHPDTKLKIVNQKKGRGVFATAFIPKGTITYVKDPLEIEVAPDDPRLQNPAIKDKIETYSYIDQDGIRIISWDNAKYVNHCCQCNTMSTGYGFELAIRDIEAGEEITDEYGMFNFDYTLQISCEEDDCRGSVSGNDLERYYSEWDQKVKSALQFFDKVTQPLEDLLEKKTRRQLQSFLETGSGYRSVLNLRSKEKKGNQI